MFFSSFPGRHSKRGHSRTSVHLAVNSAKVPLLFFCNFLQLNCFQPQRILIIIIKLKHPGGGRGGRGCDGQRAGVLRAHPEPQQPVVAHHTGWHLLWWKFFFFFSLQPGFKRVRYWTTSSRSVLVPTPWFCFCLQWPISTLLLWTSTSRLELCLLTSSPKPCLRTSTQTRSVTALTGKFTK